MPEITNLAQLEQTPHHQVFEKPAPRTVRLELAAGDAIAPHSHPGNNIVFYVVQGELDVTLDGELFTLSTGDIARFSGNHEISPEAIDDTRALIVFAPEE